MSNETALVTELLKFSPDTLLEFFVLDLTPIVEYYASKSITISPTRYYFYNGVNQREDGGSTNIVWQGNTYAKMPIEMDFINTTSGGELPRPTIKIGDNARILLPLLLSYADLVGCNIIRKRTFLKFLDAVNFNGGTSPYTPDPTACFPDETLRIERKSSETKNTIEFELAVAWDVEGILLPRRLVVANLCPWEYRKGASSSFALTSTNAADLNLSDTWTNINTINDSGLDGLISIAHNGSGIVLGVGTKGTLFRSADYGVTWTSINRFTSYNINSVAYGLGYFILACTSGRIFVGTTGLFGDWYFQTNAPTTTTLTSVTTSGGVVVLVGENKTIVYATSLASTQTNTWTAVSLGLTEIFDLRGVAYNSTNNRFIAVGSGGVILYSAVGVATSWTKAISNTNLTLNSIAVNGARSVTVGSSGVVVTSDNATNWTNRGALGSSNLNNITYTTSNIFLAVDDNKVWKSLNTNFTASNGEKWESIKLTNSIIAKSLVYIPTGTRTIIVGGKTTDAALSGCTYNGSKYFTQNDVITTDVANDLCGKRLTSCQLRFGNQNVILPFGGFPSSGFMK
jgi:lambda family phage minor tail protein L